MVPKRCKICSRPDYEHALSETGLVIGGCEKFEQDNLEYIEAEYDSKWIDHLIDEL